MPRARDEEVRGTGDGGAGAGQPLPITKLRGLSPALRRALKARRITTCPRLLAAAGPAGARAALAREAGVDPEELLALVNRADMARVVGLGVVFQMMVEELGVADLAALAGAGPVELHARLRALNAEERIARRSPTPEEVEDWVRQARGLPPLVGY